MFIDKDKYISLLADALRFQAIVSYSEIDPWTEFNVELKEFMEEMNKELNTNFNNFVNLAEYMIDNDEV